MMAEDIGSSPMADLEEMRRSAERASALARRLLAFGRRQVFQPRTLDLNDVVSGLTPVVKRLLGERIRLGVPLRRICFCVTADPGTRTGDPEPCVERARRDARTAER